MDTTMNSAVAEKIHAYPADIRNSLLFLRQLILAVAEETDGVEGLQETLKWSQPSFVSTFGSTIRIDWNPNTPDRYFMFFHCQTRLVETFRVLYEGLFEFEGNRAIVFHRDKTVPVAPLKHCISLALLYHKRKHQPLLGA